MQVNESCCWILSLISTFFVLNSSDSVSAWQQLWTETWDCSYCSLSIGCFSHSKDLPSENNSALYVLRLSCHSDRDSFNCVEPRFLSSLPVSCFSLWVWRLHHGNKLPRLMIFFFTGAMESKIFFASSMIFCQQSGRFGEDWA